MTAGRRDETPSPETRLALANADALGAGRILAVGFGPQLAPALAGRGAAVTEFHTDLRLARASPGSLFGPWLSGTGPFDAAVARLPKESQRLRMLLAMFSPLIEPGGIAVLVGRNDTGIRSAGHHLAAVGADVRTLDVRFHCRALAVTADGRAAPSSLDAWAARFGAPVAARDLRLVSYPGVFAHGRLDDGTRLLLESLPVPPGARALDVGCGNGAIATILALAGTDVDAVDTDALALAATTETLAANGARAHVFASDVYADVDRRYTHIVTNAPFHEGTRTTSTTAERLIRDAPAHLEPGGELWLVASRHLAYARALEAAFVSVEVAAQNRRYRAWRAR